VPAGDAICLALPGGGAFGDPRTRDPQRVLDDVLDGLITVDEARRDYAVVIDVQGRLDLTETERLRSS
jgi:N-methylhydantoinase B